MTTKTCFVDQSGYLCDYKTGATIRRATDSERTESEGAGATGAFECDPEAGTIDLLNEHLSRCGAQEDSSAIVARSNEDGSVTVTDGQGDWTGTPADALARLSALPDNCGWDAVWEAL